MIVSLTKRPLALLVLALAFASSWIFASVAAAQGAGEENPEPEKHAWCHATGSETNPFVLVVVQEGGPEDVAHEGHADDIDLGETTAQSPAEFLAMNPGFNEETCEFATTPPATTTTTTGTPPPKTVPPKVIVKKKPHVIVKKKPVIIKKKASVSATPTASVKTVTATVSASSKSATATASASSAASAQYTQYATVTALPSTGGSGPVLPIAVGALLLVLGSGIMVLRMARSSS